MSTDEQVSETAHLTCYGCGATAVGPQGDPTDIAPSSHCGKCPPWVCEDCGESSSSAEPCRCWTSLDGLPFADIKGLLALGNLSIGSRTRPAGGGGDE